MFNTNHCFTPGKLTICLDAQAGSSGKGKIGSFIYSHADNWQFACTTAAPQAGHWIKLDDGRSYFYQTFNSCAYMPDRYEKLYIGPGAIIELPAFYREMEQNNIPANKIGLSPLTAILQDIDQGFERGTHDFDGRVFHEDLFGNTDRIPGGYLAKTGTTAHGAGACRARRVLRRPEAKYARDIPELKEFICDVPGEIMNRLDRGQSGLLEIAQGFQLSYLLPRFYPFTTSRNCTVAAGLDDTMLPPVYAGNVVINCRTYPIRINSNKYVEDGSGRHLTWDEIEELDRQAEGKRLTKKGYIVVEGSSGGGYNDQREITWEELTKMSGSPTPLMEMTSVTKLPRRVFTFSKQNLYEAIRHNRTGGRTIVSINFANYVDHNLTGKRGNISDLQGCWGPTISGKLVAWIKNNIGDLWPLIGFIGTGARTDDMIVTDFRDEHSQLGGLFGRTG